MSIWDGDTKGVVIQLKVILTQVGNKRSAILTLLTSIRTT